jgi:hypothetical protein
MAAPARPDPQAGPSPLRFDLGQVQQAEARQGATRGKPVAELAHQSRRRRHRDEGAIAALGDQAPHAADRAGVQLHAQAAPVGAEEAQALGDTGQQGRDRRQRPHQPQAHQPRQRPQPDMEERHFQSRPGVGVTDGEAAREQRRLGKIARRHPALADTWQPHAPQAAPDMAAVLVGDRLTRAAHD